MSTLCTQMNAKYNYWILNYNQFEISDNKIYHVNVPLYLTVVIFNNSDAACAYLAFLIFNYKGDN